MTEEQYDLLVFLEQYYLTHSALPTREVAEQLGIEAKEFIAALKDETFTSALVERGVPVGALEETLGVRLTNWKSYSLTEEQLLVANCLLDLNDTRSRKKKLMECGVSTQKYASWERDPVFAAYLRERAESLLDSAQPDAHMALVDRVRSGDISAIKYFNEMTGRFVQASTRGDANQFDTKMVLIKVVEILQLHLADQPERLASIANDLIELSESPVRFNEGQKTIAYGDSSGYREPMNLIQNSVRPVGGSKDKISSIL